MNNLSTYGPGAPSGFGALAPIAPAAAAASNGNTPAWLDAAASGRSEPLHVSPGSGWRDIDSIEREFLQALTEPAAEA